jgi:predicted nucleic acid-binding Zn finger protein
VLCEEGCGRNLVLSGLVAARHSRGLVGARNILATNFVSIYTAVDYITNTKFDGCIAMSETIIQRGKREEKSIRLLTTKTNCGYISLIGVHISTDIVTGIVLLTHEVVLLCELCGQLTVSGEIYTHLSLIIIEGYTYSIAEHVRKKQTVSIWMLTHIS